MGQIYGVDMFPKRAHDEERTRTCQGSQNDPKFLRRLASEYGPFDTELDDGKRRG